ncbi:hypothetical protein HPB47_022530 [Ixodes persulcatus]|uniref:Uncharacterized protein n=1 Tax=Ixodes persulcatus TaxID=34615 RepID=A0AC60Q9W8_IXOPE|nr:hypothetical protein HPB47_022530 [Ixodes persulcatus]
MVTLIPQGKKKKNAFHVLNVYSNLKSPKDCVQKLFKEALKISGHDPIILGGAFNAAHTLLGYRYTTPKGKRIFNTMYQEGLTLLTDPTTPTRTGTSSCRDTCPDLTFVKNVKDAKWENTNENLGSDHFILETTATCTSVKPRKLGQVKIIEWDKWREHKGVSTSTIEDIESWTREAVSSTAAYTKVLTVDEETPCVDPHLLHMWDARRSLTKRWKNQRLNRKLKIKIQEINHKAEEYAAELTRQNWYNLCDSIQGRLNSASTWKLLRALLDPNNTRTATCKRISELVFKSLLTAHEMFDKLASKYLCIEPPKAQNDYHGRANPALDEPIAVWELEYDTGLYNTIEELWEAQRISQIKRLSETPNGRWLLERLQLATPGGILHQEPKQELTPTVRGKITVEKIPRNMNSERNANRRRVRAQTISRIWSKKPGTLYADAAILPRGNTATLAVADPRGNVVRTASVYTTLTEHAEEAAIAHGCQRNLTQTTLTLKGRSTSSRKARGPALANRDGGSVLAIGQRRPSRLLEEVERPLSLKSRRSRCYKRENVALDSAFTARARVLGRDAESSELALAASAVSGLQLKFNIERSCYCDDINLGAMDKGCWTSSKPIAITNYASIPPVTQYCHVTAAV